MEAALEPASLERVRAELEEIEGVRRVVIDGPPYVVYVIAERGARFPAEMVVHSVLFRHGLGPGDAELHLAYTGVPEPRRRVRFVSAIVDSSRVGRAQARVQLEWAGQTHVGELEGETGPAPEQRLTSLATLAALDQVLEGRVRFQLVGIKPLRAFDADVVVALLKSDVDGRSLIGAALAADDPNRAASVAVLNATNRILGNYLSNSEAQETGS
jgi:hypothetical protein